MYAVVFGDLSIVFVLVILAGIALPWWAVVDVASRPRESFASSGLTKRTWLFLLIGFTVFTFFVGLGIALYYVFKVQPKMKRRVRADEFGTRLLRSTSVLFLVIASMSMTYVVSEVKSLLSSHTPHVAVEGYLHGQCTTGNLSTEGRRLSVKLTTGYSGKVVGVATMAGRTGRNSFYFAVAPGTYKLTATSGTTTHHWGLSYAWGIRSSPQTVPPPVAMNVPVSVVC